jgi:hypothetical protein
MDNSSLKTAGISIENLEEFSIPMAESESAWMFTGDGTDELPSDEFQDQICVLNKEASQFLWDYKMKVSIWCTPTYFKTISSFNCWNLTEKEMKKRLFDLEIPFDEKFYIAMQPDSGFILTWKMVIKFSYSILFNSNTMDLVLRNKSGNFQVEYQKGTLRFGKDYIFDSQGEALRQCALQEEIQLQKQEMKAKYAGLNAKRK